MKYWLIYTDSVTNFKIIESEDKPKITQITKTEFVNKKDWLKKWGNEK
jgi:hypothetical protein